MIDCKQQDLRPAHRGICHQRLYLTSQRPRICKCRQVRPNFWMVVLAKHGAATQTGASASVFPHPRQALSVSSRIKSQGNHTERQLRSTRRAEWNLPQLKTECVSTWSSTACASRHARMEEPLPLEKRIDQPWQEPKPRTQGTANELIVWCCTGLLISDAHFRFFLLTFGLRAFCRFLGILGLLAHGLRLRGTLSKWHTEALQSRVAAFSFSFSSFPFSFSSFPFLGFFLQKSSFSDSHPVSPHSYLT